MPGTTPSKHAKTGPKSVLQRPQGSQKKKVNTGQVALVKVCGPALDAAISGFFEVVKKLLLRLLNACG
eukprot:COSAG06_NODE_407_length_16111_cov_3.252748_12_plen_68_part_00